MADTPHLEPGSRTPGTIVDPSTMVHAREIGVTEPLTGPVRQGYRALRAGYTLVPLVAGADKFANVLCRWEKYLAPQLPRLLGVRPRSFMRFVGVVEIAGGLLAATAPRLGGLVVSAWLGGIIGNLLLARRDYDIALRDLGLAVGAYATSRLATAARED